MAQVSRVTSDSYVGASWGFTVVRKPELREGDPKDVPHDVLCALIEFAIEGLGVASPEGMAQILRDEFEKVNRAGRGRA